MLRWFRETAPIRRKLSIAFSLQTFLVAFCLGAGLLGASGQVTISMAATLRRGAPLLSAVRGVVMRKAMADSYVSTVVRMEALAAGDLDTPIQFTAYTDCVGR